MLVPFSEQNLANHVKLESLLIGTYLRELSLLFELMQAFHHHIIRFSKDLLDLVYSKGGLCCVVTPILNVKHPHVLTHLLLFKG